MLVVPAPSSRRGGVPENPLGFWSLKGISRRSLRLSLLSCLGFLVAFTCLLTAAFRAPILMLSTLHSFAHQVEALQGAPWILGLDGNIPMTSGPWASAMTMSGGMLRAVARHSGPFFPLSAWSGDSLALPARRRILILKRAPIGLTLLARTKFGLLLCRTWARRGLSGARTQKQHGYAGLRFCC